MPTGQKCLDIYAHNLVKQRKRQIVLKPKTYHWYWKLQNITKKSLNHCRVDLWPLKLPNKYNWIISRMLNCTVWQFVLRDKLYNPFNMNIVQVTQWNITQSPMPTGQKCLDISIKDLVKQRKRQIPLEDTCLHFEWNWPFLWVLRTFLPRKR